ncbi:DUF58 domain-containing protein [Roseiconus lacunae]|uniref:DUF58 domain-containing protein n=1 Tax=Roseiconus lacunae TaxID=2605694 RepID=UPI0011F2D5C3|nr:DUF58 domain-containing protein [Roseiconus lacunae]
MPSFFDGRIAERLAALPLVARSAMLGSVSGRHQSPHRGSSVEFAEYRRYQAGDDLRRLDWRAYGRSDRYYVKEFEADTNLRLVLVVDGSGSMGFEQKLEVARQLAATLAYLAIGQGDAAGLVTASAGSHEHLPPRRIAGQVEQLFKRLEHLTPVGTNSMCQAISQLAESSRERAMVVLVSDFLFEFDQLRTAIDHLTFRKHDVVAFHVLSPQELNPGWDRPTRLLDMEGDESMLVDPEEIRAGYEDAVREYLESIEQLMHRSAVDYHRMLTDGTVEETLSRFLSARLGDVSR